MSAVDEPQSRAEVLSTVFKAGASVVAAAAIPTSAVFADGATSAATQARARGIYGTRIESLKPLVDKGDSAAVLAEQNAFKLFVSGVYSTDKAKKAEAGKLADAVLSAAKSGDAGALKSSYAAFIKYTAKPSGFSGAGEGQGFGSEFDYKNRFATQKARKRHTFVCTVLQLLCTCLRSDETLNLPVLSPFRMRTEELNVVSCLVCILPTN